MLCDNQRILVNDSNEAYLAELSVLEFLKIVFRMNVKSPKNVLVR